jgi:hypothetical protein
MRGSKDIEKDLLTARNRDLRPIFCETVELLELDEAKARRLEDFLTLAWFSGTRTGGAQMAKRAELKRMDVGPIRLEETEEEFRALMEDSADALNLTVGRTINLWQFLAKAWLRGAKSCEAELTAALIETQHDISAEAQQWLGKQDDPPGS